METVYLWRKDSFLLPGVTRHSLPFTYDFFSPVSFLTFLCQVLIEGEVCIYPPTGLPSVSESSETQTSSWSPTWHGQVLCALCSSLQPLAAWNSLNKSGKVSRFEMPHTRCSMDRVQMLGCSFLCSGDHKTGSGSCLCHLQYRDVTGALISPDTPSEGCVCLLNPGTQPENSRSYWGFKRVLVPKSPTTLKISPKKPSASKISVIIC